MNYKIYSNFVCTYKLQLAKMVNSENSVTIRTMYTFNTRSIQQGPGRHLHKG